MYKLILFTILLGVSIYFYIVSNRNTLVNTPQSSQNLTKLNFDKLITDKQLDVSNLIFDPYNHIISFNLFENEKSTKVILSDQKNIWLQLNALQKINKMVKIKNRSLQLVDLSLKHPYATIKDY